MPLTGKALLFIKFTKESEIYIIDKDLIDKGCCTTNRFASCAAALFALITTVDSILIYRILFSRPSS